MNCLTVICLFVGASLSSAQTIDLRPYDITAQNLFTANDVDKDQEMSHSELVLSFNGYDANFDGVVSREEYTTYTTHQNPAMFVLTHALYDIYDSDKNGVLTEYDYEQLYKLWDGNGPACPPVKLQKKQRTACCANQQWNQFCVGLAV